MLRCRGVTRTYGQGSSAIAVLRELQLTMERGETVAILGPSGSGKSTLLGLLAGLDRPDAGTIELAETELTQLSEESLTLFRGKHIGIIFQQYHLVSTLTALENICLPLELAGHSLGEARKRAESALSAVSLRDRADHFPHQMSGGECQRVAIARAMITEPDLLLADEPSGNLDQQTAHQVMDYLFSAVEAKGQTMILVTHNVDLAKRCRRQFLLCSGALQPC